MDEYHAREHVWDVARAAFAAEPDVRDAWAHQVIDLLSLGRVQEVVTAIEKLPPLSPESGKPKSVQETEAEYFRTNQQRIRYPLFRAQGMHLGSGIAEAACKTVVSTRPNAPACGGLLTVWLPFWLYVPLFSASSLSNAGERTTRALDDGLQFFPTPSSSLYA